MKPLITIKRELLVLKVPTIRGAVLLGLRMLVCVLAFLIPLDKLGWSEGSSTPTPVRWLAIPTGAALLLYQLVAGKVVKPPAAILMAVLFLIWAAITLTWSRDAQSGLASLLDLTQYLFFAYMIVCLFADEKLDVFLVAFVGGCIVASFTLMYTTLTSTKMGALRGDAFGSNPNEISHIITLSVIAVGYLCLKRVRNRAIALALIGGYLLLAAGATIAAASRGGFIALLAAVGCLFLLPGISLRKRVVLAIAALCLAVVVTQYGLRIMPRGVLRIATTLQNIQEGDLNSREDIWRAAWHVFSDHPLVGIGLGAFRPVVWGGFASHNAFVGLAVETGLIGFVLFMSILGMAFMAVKDHAPQIAVWLSYSLLTVWAVSALSGDMIWRKVTWLMVGVILAIAQQSLIRKRDVRLAGDEAKPA